MPGRITDADVQAMLNHRYGMAYMYNAPFTYYIGLSTTQPNPDGTGFTEPVGNNYARVAYANNLTNFPTMVMARRPEARRQLLGPEDMALEVRRT